MTVPVSSRRDIENAGTSLCSKETGHGANSASAPNGSNANASELESRTLNSPGTATTSQRRPQYFRLFISALVLLFQFHKRRLLVVLFYLRPSVQFDFYKKFYYSVLFYFHEVCFTMNINVYYRKLFVRFKSMN